MFVKTRQHTGDGVQNFVNGFVRATGYQGRQPVVVAVAPHDDDRFGRPSGRVAEMGDPKIAVRS